jgi:hypothetical protein
MVRSIHDLFAPIHTAGEPDLTVIKAVTIKDFHDLNETFPGTDLVVISFLDANGVECIDTCIVGVHDWKPAAGDVVDIKRPEGETTHPTVVPHVDDGVNQAA